MKQSRPGVTTAPSSLSTQRERMKPEDIEARKSEQRSRHASAEFQGNRSDARVCVLSLRSVNRHPARCCGYEFEDAICDVDDANLAVAAAQPLRQPPRRLLNLISRSTPWELTAKRRLRRRELDRVYDLTFAVIQSPSHLANLKSFKDWRKKSRVAVCFVEELWQRWMD